MQCILVPPEMYQRNRCSMKTKRQVISMQQNAIFGEDILTDVPVAQ